MKPLTQDNLRLLARILGNLCVLVGIYLVLTVWDPQGAAWWVLLVASGALAFRRRLARLVGSAFAKIRPEQVVRWRAHGPILFGRRLSASRYSQPDFTDAEIGAFCLAGVSYDEAARIGTNSLLAYRYARLVERRTGLRFGTDGLGRVDVADLLSYVSVCLPRGVRRLNGAVRLVPVDRLRALAVLAAGTTSAGLSLPDALRAVHAYDRVLRQVKSGADPVEVLGWVLAVQAALDDGVVEGARKSLGSYQSEIDPLGKVQRLYLLAGPKPLQDIPLWLLPLAGIRPGEALPAEVTPDSLRVLAVLRGHPLHLLDLVVSESLLSEPVAV